MSRSSPADGLSMLPGSAAAAAADAACGARRSNAGIGNTVWRERLLNERLPVHVLDFVKSTPAHADRSILQIHQRHSK